MGSLVVPHIYDIREGLNKALIKLREHAPVDICDKPTARGAARLCVEALMENFTSKWGSSKNVMTYRERKRSQPRRVRSEKLMVAALGRRTKVFYDIEEHEHEGLWTIVSRRTAGWPGSRQNIACSVGWLMCHSCCISSASKQPRIEFMPDSMAHAGTFSSVLSPTSSHDATSSVLSKRWRRSSRSSRTATNGQEIFPDPLHYWASRAHDVSLLVPLAWRVS